MEYPDGRKQAPCIEWFNAHLNYEGDECLIWPFGKLRAGYGTVALNGKTQLVHRLVCAFHHGPSPGKGYEAAHFCGNPSCLNPRHLRWATRSENHADMLRHGTAQRGEKHGISKLTHDQVREIRATKGKVMASKYGISQSHANAVKRGVWWGWMEPT